MAGTSSWIDTGVNISTMIIRLRSLSLCIPRDLGVSRVHHSDLIQQQHQRYTFASIIESSWYRVIHDVELAINLLLKSKFELIHNSNAKFNKKRHRTCIQQYSIPKIAPQNCNLLKLNWNHHHSSGRDSWRECWRLEILVSPCCLLKPWLVDVASHTELVWINQEKSCCYVPSLLSRREASSSKLTGRLEREFNGMGCSRLWWPASWTGHWKQITAHKVCVTKTTGRQRSHWMESLLLTTLLIFNAGLIHVGW